MPELPDRPDLDHLKKQAKELLRGYHDGDPAALARFRAALPAATELDDSGLIAAGLRLRDAQSCIAREYGFLSWADLRSYIISATEPDPAGVVRRWLHLVYGGVSGDNDTPRPRVAARLLAEQPRLLGADPYLACVVGDEHAVRRALAADADWANRPGGPLDMPPLVAVTHSSLVRLPEFADGVRRCARSLLAAGADPDQSFTSPGGHPLSALYGAAGLNHDRELTQLLLDAGADPDDNESLYHSLDDPGCTQLLLAAGARIEGTNAMFRVFDLDNENTLRLLLDHGGDPNERSGGLGLPLLWAIRRRRSAAHIRMLLDAGTEPSVSTPDGVSAYRLALRHGLPEVAALLRDAAPTAVEPLDVRELLVAACAAGDGDAAQRLLAAHPGIVDTLDGDQLRLLPELAAAGAGDAVRLMVEAGWPIDARGGDWAATALNHAVFRGDAALTRFLLDHGADWTVQHGFGDTVVGTLSWASRNSYSDEVGDWVGCAEALLEYGVPRPDPAAGYEFSDAVAEVLED